PRPGDRWSWRGVGRRVDTRLAVVAGCAVGALGRRRRVDLPLASDSHAAHGHAVLVGPVLKVGLGEMVEDVLRDLVLVGVRSAVIVVVYLLADDVGQYGAESLGGERVSVGHGDAPVHDVGRS